jgi:WD domain, G-beta repeat/Planctomycete cytochrome C
MNPASLLALTFGLISVLPSVLIAAADAPPDYARHVAPVFRKYCVGCHNAKDHEGKLNLQSYAGLMRGGEEGKVLVAKNVAKSRIIGMLERKLEPFMPPKGNKGPTKTEIAVLKAWIKAGAIAPKGISPNDTLVVPMIKPTGKVRRAIDAIAASKQWIAIARHGVVELLDAKTGKLQRKLTGLTGDVTDVVFSNDGKLLAAACGEPGLFGLAVVWETKTWQPVARLKGHHDGLYCVAISPDAKTLATGSYDQKIKLWDIAKKAELRQLDGHNGPVHDLTFHPTGKILASASGDRTVKLWDVATGKRLDTLGQPEKDQYTVAFSPDGKRVVAGGVDNRIRVWAVTQMGKEGTNPLLYSRFAHEGPILRFVFSPDGKRLYSSSEDRTVKSWDTKQFTQLRTLKGQSDWVTGLATSADGRTLFIGRLNGTFESRPLGSGGPQVAQATPVLLEPIPGVSPDQLKPLVSLKEAEPNDTPQSAQRIAIPANVEGVLQPAKPGTQDFDVYRFHAKAGQSWILETNAARRKSPADTKLEVLHADGRPVLRYLLRAVRDSNITFRPIDSRQAQVRVTNWEEMDLNQYMYLGGEVCRLFQAPRGPDSGYDFYTGRGKRRTYFDTSATVHANDEPVYIVEAYRPGTKLVDNGLPVFPLYFANDDDGERELGSDSRLTFAAPADGDYLVRVSDTLGRGGKDYKYTLTIRPPKPDFKVSLSVNQTIPAGSGQRLSVNVDRIDGFNGEIHIDVTGLPRGFGVTSPMIVEADHVTVRGVVTVEPWVTPTVFPKAKKAKKGRRKGKQERRRSGPVVARKPVDWSRVKINATAWIHGKKVTKTLPSFGPIRVSPKPRLVVRLVPDPTAKPQAGVRTGELSMSPGTTMTAMLLVERHGYNGDLKFDVDHLPHGVIVDNIGLSGILVRAGETKRRIYLTAAKWVAPTTRKIDAVAQGQGNQASKPIVFHVIRNDQIPMTNDQ